MLRSCPTRGKASNGSLEKWESYGRSWRMCDGKWLDLVWRARLMVWPRCWPTIILAGTLALQRGISTHCLPTWVSIVQCTTSIRPSKLCRFMIHCILHHANCTLGGKKKHWSVQQSSSNGSKKRGRAEYFQQQGQKKMSSKVPLAEAVKSI